MVYYLHISASSKKVTIVAIESIWGAFVVIHLLIYLLVAAIKGIFLLLILCSSHFFL